MKTKVKAFVDAYNARRHRARARSSGEDGRRRDDDRRTPPRARCSATPACRACSRRCASRMGDRIAGLTGLDELADIGISMPKPTGSTSEDAKDGKLAIDDAKLAEALAADPRKVRDLLRRLLGASLDDVHQEPDRHRRRARPARQVRRRRRSSASPTQADLAETRLQAQGEAPQGPVRGHGDGAANSQTQSAWLSGQLSSLVPSSCQRSLNRRAVGPITGRPIPSVSLEVVLTAYTANPSAAYQPAERHDRDARAARRDALRRRAPLPASRPPPRCARTTTLAVRPAAAPRRGDHRRAARDARHRARRRDRRGLEGIYVFCKRP